jgi:alkanesulfonate monooxygenase SsuD/methylene tetrahydromethanopterin reductase-like flavin-dependent oxidoreductase (luciferase family)
MIDPAVKRDAWLEGLEVAIRCMTEEPFGGHAGTYVTMPPRNVVPKPVQKPHPPLWVACSRRDTILLAAQKGIGALSFAFIDPEEAIHWITDYEATLEKECVPVGKAINPKVACVTPMMCASTEEEALRRGLEGGNFFGYSLGHYYVFGDHVPGKTDVWQQYVKRRSELGYSPEVVLAVEQERLGAKVASGDTTGLRGATGTPEQLREYCKRFEDAGVDELIFVMQAGNNKHEDICESIELFGKEVLPEFKERDDATWQAKLKRLEPVLEQAMARKTDDAPRMPEDFSMPALPLQMVNAAGNEAGKKWLQEFADQRAKGERDEALGIIG